MVLAQWLERGLGQFFAPDPNYDSQADIIDTQSSLWQMLAPDPKFSPNRKASTSSAGATPPPPHAFRTPSSSRVGGVGGMDNIPATATPMSGSIGKITSPKDIPPALQEEILKAAFDTARMYKRNGKYKNDAKNLFGYASQKRSPDPKMKEKLRLLLQNDLQQYKEHSKLLLEEGGGGESGGEVQPPLYEARSIKNVGASCPEGHTPLQAAARSGAIDVAKMLLQLGQDENDDDNMTILRHQLQRTNVFGQTAKHLAAEFHREEMVDLIQQCEQQLLLLAASPKNHSFQNNQNSDDSNEHNIPFASPPFASPAVPQQDAIDILGRTPFGTLLTSPAPQGRRCEDKSNSLRNKLFSPDDFSLIGSPALRAKNMLQTVEYPDIHTAHATAHLNGMRVDNEDALFAKTWQYSDDNNNNNNRGERCPVGFFIVCDGHGDRAAISNHVVRKLPQLLRQGMMESSFSSSSHDDWTRLCTTACSMVDLELKKLGWLGGATAIFCLVTKDHIVVGNVGDSRCILVEHKPKSPNTTNDDEDDDKAAAAAGQQSGDSSVDNLTESMNQQLSLSGTDGSPTVASPPSESHLLAVSGETMTVVATALSEDHKANLPDERARVEKAGLEVIELKYQDQHGNDATRFKVKLSEGNMVDFSRSLGDFDYKNIQGLADHEQPIVCIPDVRIIDRHSIAPESYLVLACDGVWDVKSNDDVANFLTKNIHSRLADATGEDILSNVGDDLLKACIDSDDNLSTIIVALSQAADMMVSASQRLQGRHSNTPHALAFG